MNARRWITQLLSGAALLAAAAVQAQGALVDAAWLQRQLQQPDATLVLLDASPAPHRRAGHIPGSRAAEPWVYLLGDPTPVAMERAFRSWGLNANSRIVVVDQGASWEAARLFHDLQGHGVAPGRLHLLDGGLAAWRAAGGAVATGGAMVAVAAGDVRVTTPVPGREPTLAEVLQASGAPSRSRLLDALEPPYFAGSARFFDRGGHLPHARNWPVSAMFDAQRKTFRPLPELRAMAAQLGVTPGIDVISYCGGGGAAAVPWFVLTQLLGHEATRLYTGSQREWMQDPRGLPLWTHAEPALMRDTAWATGWTSGMLRHAGRGLGTVLDVRDAAAFQQGHLPDALNLPAAELRALRADPAALAARLAALGLDPAHEAVIASDRGGVSPDAALAWLALQRAGQARTSLLMDSPERAAELGVELKRDARPAPPRQAGERRLAVPASPEGRAALPLLRVAVGDAALTPAAAATHLPWRGLVGADGRPLPAGELRARLAKAGLPVLARIEVLAEDPGDAAAGVYLLRLMGYADSEARGF